MTELLTLSVGVFLGAVVSSFSGFAFSAVAGAILLHAYDPLTAIPIMMACSITSQTITLMMLRKSLHFGGAAPLLAGGAAGVVLAMQVIRWMDPAGLRLTFGLFLVVYAGYLILRDQTRQIDVAGRPYEFTAGALGGVVGVFTAMPGAVPTLWCELRGFSKEQQRGLVQPSSSRCRSSRSPCWR
jgi:uncharacterized protein